MEKPELIILDGGMGTQLQAAGLPMGQAPELWNLTRPRDVQAIHAAYFEAGADIVYANTFGANPAKYHGDAPLRDVIGAAIANARAVAPAGKFVALDVGPTGRLLKPAGDFAFDAAYDAFAEQVRLGAEAGADLIAIETVNDTYELKAALLAARENADLPVVATVALSEDGKLLTGGDVDCVAALFEALKPDACGFNCGLGPDRLLPFVKRLVARVRRPVVVKANAGLPRVVDGRTFFDVGPAAFAADIAACAEAGAAIVGGCCGTTPGHIRAVAARLAGTPVRARPDGPAPTVVSSCSRCVELTPGDSLVIGERINPTGKKKLKEAYRSGDTGYILREAIAQADAGAHILDVNAGVPGIDEPAVLRATVEAIQGVTDVPLQIDTSDPAALEAALRHYNGAALVNSVNGKREVMDAVFPLVAKYGGVVVALTLDEDGIPPTSEGRLAIARKILARGGDYGRKPSDFLIDVLCLAVSAEAQSGNVILESLRRVRDELGCRTCLGVSNISFGLPSRPLLNATFYTLALEAGLSAGIVNPLSDEMMTAYRAFRALTARDGHCAEWVEVESQRQIVAAASPKFKAPAAFDNSGSPLQNAIRRGLKADAAEAAKTALGAGEEPLRLIDSGIVPALEEVGKGFEAGKVFLPQLLMAADAAGAAFDVIRANFPAQAGAAKGPIVMATVKGDIHDIGKNICRALLENYGFKVIDLGRDVAPGKVLEAAQKSKAPLVGLSALMTTTVGAMEETIALLHRELPSCKVAVGGAVLTADFAAKIGADHYTKDAMELVRLAEKVLG